MSVEDVHYFPSVLAAVTKTFLEVELTWALLSIMLAA